VRLIVCSGPKDHVFVYFADHGAAGLLCFPTPIEGLSVVYPGVIVSHFVSVSLFIGQ